MSKNKKGKKDLKKKKKAKETVEETTCDIKDLIGENPYLLLIINEQGDIEIDYDSDNSLKGMFKLALCGSIKQVIAKTIIEQLGDRAFVKDAMKEYSKTMMEPIGEPQIIKRPIVSRASRMYSRRDGGDLDE